MFFWQIRDTLLLSLEEFTLLFQVYAYKNLVDRVYKGELL
jgi:hypothetical protein